MPLATAQTQALSSGLERSETFHAESRGQSDLRDEPRARPASSGVGKAKVPTGLERSDTTLEQSEITIPHATAMFVALTNMPGITVKGKSEALHARVRMRRVSDGVALDSVEAWLPVKTLATGIALRDHHMRQYVFTTGAGEVPDVHFEAASAFCPGVVAGREVSCKLTGNLSIRGIARAFTMTVKIREANAAPMFRAGGDGVIRLSDYGIEPPSQFGVKTANEIQIHLEFPETTASPAGTPSTK